ncbi:MAG: cobB [Bryobacterales bacterium]|nr:cobB [Bryobacterales bacterium]
MNIPRIVIAGTHSGVGKTTVSTGIMAAFHRRGLRVQGFKVGPDFIDPTFHQAATNRPGHNLDGWMLSRETNLEIFGRAAGDADVAVIEGVMGLFDGRSSPSLSGTTAEMAIWLDAAVALVLDAAAMAGSAAAVVHGFDTLIPDFRLSAVICNKVASAKHYGYLRDAMVARCSPSPIGYLPRDTKFSMPERHLGLHPAQEALTAERLDLLARWIESHLDLDRLLELGSRPNFAALCLPDLTRKPARARIGIARDAAFCFYYHDNLGLLRTLGAELIGFSPIADRTLPPDLDGLYLGGGYPELHAEALSANESMRAAIVDFAAEGAPVYAECGGFMYLMHAIVDSEGRNWPMAGVFPTSARMQKQLAKLGYIEVESCEAEAWLGPDENARGHEFRYSTMDPMPETIGRVYRDPAEGYRVLSVVGSYVHLHFLSNPKFAERFVHDCAQHRAVNPGRPVNRK